MLSLGWVWWMPYCTYVAPITPIWPVIANPRLTHQATRPWLRMPSVCTTRLCNCSSRAAAWAVARWRWGWCFYSFQFQVSTHLHSSVHPQTSAHAHTPPRPPLYTLSYSPAPGPTAAYCDMKSDTVNLPPNPSGCGLNSDDTVVRLGDWELWQLLTAIHPQALYLHKFPQQWNRLHSTIKCSHSKSQC